VGRLTPLLVLAFAVLAGTTPAAQSQMGASGGHIVFVQASRPCAPCRQQIAVINGDGSGR
jgi:hypothetical protein